jgi:hypothetical protein
MTWSYNPSDLSSSQKDQIRMLIGDTNASTPQLQDEEIAYLATLRPNIYGAASDCCRALAAKYSSMSTESAGDSKITYSDISKAYARQAIAFASTAAAGGAGLPYAGGISQNDKQTQESDTDRVSPQFQIGMEDNLLPIGPVGNESQDESNGALGSQGG